MITVKVKFDNDVEVPYSVSSYSVSTNGILTLTYSATKKTIIAASHWKAIYVG